MHALTNGYKKIDQPFKEKPSGVLNLRHALSYALDHEIYNTPTDECQWILVDVCVCLCVCFKISL